MATLTKGHTFASGDTVTATKLNDLVDSATIAGVDTADISDGAITNAKVDASAAIVASKLNLTSLGLSAWQTKTTTYTAVAGDRINADTSGGAFTLTLPSTPATYAEVKLADHAGTWDTNNLTVARNGSNINGGAADLTCDVEGKQIVLRYEGATIGWRIYT